MNSGRSRAVALRAGAMNFALKVMSFVSKMMNFGRCKRYHGTDMPVLQPTDAVNFSFKMMIFV